MFGKLGAALSVFKVGSEVADPAKWKARQVKGNMVAALLLALVVLGKQYGIEIPLDMDSAMVIGGGIVTLVNVLLTWSTSTKAGVPGTSTPEPVPTQDPTSWQSTATGPTASDSAKLQDEVQSGN